MTTKKRMFKCLPFIAVASLLIHLRVKEEGCWGPIEFLYPLLLIVGVAITGSIAFVAAFSKRKADELGFEPFTLSIVFIVSTAMVFSKFVAEIVRGDDILIAQVVNTNVSFSTHTLKLRAGGKYLVQVQEIEWICTYGGRFTLTGDTLTLSKTVAAETGSNFVEKYVFNGDRLIPLRRHTEFLDTMRRPLHLQILRRR